MIILDKSIQTIWPKALAANVIIITELWKHFGKIIKRKGMGGIFISMAVIMKGII